ncbi:unnamed protein product, partial [Ectocarpus sp. 13 AM-2016]
RAAQVAEVGKVANRRTQAADVKKAANWERRRKSGQIPDASYLMVAEVRSRQRETRQSDRPGVTGRAAECVSSRQTASEETQPMCDRKGSGRSGSIVYLKR